MYKNKKILAVIPARGGSKGIPEKNIVEVNGRPLIDYTISEALKSKYLDNVIVSTDSEKIAEIAKKCRAEVPFLRPKNLAEDQSKTIDVLINLIYQLTATDIFFDYIVLLQPTQPLRKSFHIDEAIELAIDNEYKSLLSVNLVQEHPILVRTIDNQGRLKNLLNINSTVRRQDFPTYYKVNGAIYINKIDDDFNENTSLNDNQYSYIMDKEYDLDIDEPLDLEVLKIKLGLKGY
jgi:CMP-N,N'-diacetyllegionaminic acid synthase